MKPFLLWIGVGVLAGVAGCDFGHAYETRMKESRETLDRAETLAQVLQANVWGQNNLGLELRLPQGMSRLKEPTVDASGAVTPSTDLDVLPPPNLALPNRIATFRAHVEVGVSAERRRMPMYLYISGAKPTAEQAGAEGVAAGAFLDQVSAVFQQSFPAATGSETKEYPAVAIHGVVPKRFQVRTAQAPGEFVAIRGRRDVPETAEASVELYLYEDANGNRAALLFYWPQGTVQAERPSEIQWIRQRIDLCLETVKFRDSQ